MKILPKSCCVEMLHLDPYRISALGIVGDLLRKVGALELKLVSREGGNGLLDNSSESRWVGINAYMSEFRPVGPRGP